MGNEMSLRKHISFRVNKSRKIGVIGTAKNTGKTTTISFLMKRSYQTGLPIAVTGIGYDGEAIDNLTLLPKPRLDVFPGLLIATAEECVRQANLKYDLIMTTEENTSLGKVQLIKVRSEGRILLAGPNNTESLERLLAPLGKKAPLILIDGALGRMVPMSAADAVIFATGAARTTDISSLASKMKAIQNIFHLEGFPNIPCPQKMPDHVCVHEENGREKTLPETSLLREKDGKALAQLLSDRSLYTYLPGAVTLAAWRGFFNENPKGLNRMIFYFRSPAMLLAGGKPLEVWKNMEELLNRGVRASYLHPLPILAVTINPFYPKQKGRRGLFEPAFVDENQLFKEFSRQLELPLFNILKQGGESLFKLVRSESFSKEKI